jgi:hypothetical protein
MLTLPAMLSKINELGSFDQNVVNSISECQISSDYPLDDGSQPLGLLNTIKYTRTLASLAQRLPKSNYRRKMSQQGSVEVFSTQSNYNQNLNSAQSSGKKS